MKLQDLAAPQKTKQIAKVMESYFGQDIDFGRLNRTQARNMLHRVRALISEQRRQPGFHQSQNNPAYLKLVMMEQGLSHRISEQTAAAGQTPQQSAAQQSAMMAQKKRQIQDTIKDKEEQIRQMQQEVQQLRQQANSPVMPVMESEVQQAQVVLASQDMVDQVQKMIEQITATQYKDLPALVDQIRNEVGLDQAQQFNNDATSALTALTQATQAAKQQLETALGVVTGQAATVPGQELGAEVPAVPAPMPGEEEIAVGDEEEIEEPASDLETSLGRGRR